MDTTIQTLGPAKIPSPIKRYKESTHYKAFISDEKRVVIDLDYHHLNDLFLDRKDVPSFELAGPRENVYFDTSKLRCAIVTCGGLCPGLNDIIRSVVLELNYSYQVKSIYGIRYGLRGFIPEFGHDVMELTPREVGNIHEMGGSILGSSRGPQAIDEIIDCLERMNIGVLFMTGGDGTLKAAIKIADEISNRGLKISVIGIPKTIDNDIYMVSRSFGFDTAVDVATMAIRSAHNEARGYPNGIGLIKLMGRHSGFIAATASLAQQDVNFVLIPEVDFDLKGENGFLTHLEKRLKQSYHAVVVVAEGAGQNIFEIFEEGHKDYDESGNVRLHDIGQFLKEAIKDHFNSLNIPISLKYIDPSYMIRSLPANSNDRVFCSFLGRNAVHAAMAGKTKLSIGNWNNQFVHVPINLSVSQRKHVDPNDKLWLGVLDATGQGAMKNFNEDSD